jgi:hypothetical protein
MRLLLESTSLICRHIYFVITFFFLIFAETLKLKIMLVVQPSNWEDDTVDINLLPPEMQKKRLELNRFVDKAMCGVYLLGFIIFAIAVIVLLTI